MLIKRLPTAKVKTEPEFMRDISKPELSQAPINPLTRMTNQTTRASWISDQRRRYSLSSGWSSSAVAASDRVATRHTDHRTLSRTYRQSSISTIIRFKHLSSDL